MDTSIKREKTSFLFNSFLEREREKEGGVGGGKTHPPDTGPPIPSPATSETTAYDLKNRHDEGGSTGLKTADPLASQRGEVYVSTKKVETPPASHLVQSDSSTKKRTYRRLDDIDEAAIRQVAKKYRVHPNFVATKLEDLRDYCQSRGKTYKNYLAALRSFVRRDLDKAPKVGTNRITPPIKLPPKKPLTKAEKEQISAAWQANLPEFLRKKIQSTRKRDETI